MGQRVRQSRRLAAAVIAATTGTCLLWTFYDYSYGLTALRKGLVDLSLFYTHGATLFLTLYFGGIALGRNGWARSRLYGHAIIVMEILLAHYWIFEGLTNFIASPLRSKLIHGPVPIMIALFWLAFVRDGRLRWSDPVRWTALPILYTVYGLTRGAITGTYPYTVSDVGRHGYPLVLGLVAATTLAAYLAGCAIVWIDRQLPLRNRAAFNDPPHRFNRKPC